MLPWFWAASWGAVEPRLAKPWDVPGRSRVAECDNPANVRKCSTGRRHGPAACLLLHPPQIAGQVVLETLLDQADGHARLALHGQVVKQPSAGGINPNRPTALETTEIPLEHPEAQTPEITLLGELQLHAGTEPEAAELLGAHLLQADPVLATPELAGDGEVGDEAVQVLVVGEHRPQPVGMQIEAQLYGQATGPLGQPLHHLMDGVEAASPCIEGNRHGGGGGGSGRRVGRGEGGSQKLGQIGTMRGPGRVAVASATAGRSLDVGAKLAAATG